jgi:hypothetical protein
MRVIKTRKMRAAVNLACKGETKNACKFSIGKVKGGDQSEYLGVDGKIILEWMSGK